MTNKFSSLLGTKPTPFQQVRLHRRILKDWHDKYSIWGFGFVFCYDIVLALLGFIPMSVGYGLARLSLIMSDDSLILILVLASIGIFLIGVWIAIYHFILCYADMATSLIVIIKR